MSNGAYGQAKEIAFFRQMLPELLSKLEKSKFESRKETRKTAKTHQDFIEKIAEVLWERAQQQKGSDSWNPIKSYKSTKSAAERQQEILRSFLGSAGMKKYKNTAFQKGIKDIGQTFLKTADDIDPKKQAMLAGVASSIDLAGKISTLATGFDFVGEIGKKGFKAAVGDKIKSELGDIINPIKNLKETFSKIGEGGVKDAISRLGEGRVKDVVKKIKDGDIKYEDLASELSKSLEAGSKGLKKISKKGTDYMKGELESEQSGTQKLYFEPSDYFKYITQSQNRYL
jgi:hypothetical protein